MAGRRSRVNGASRRSAGLRTAWFSTRFSSSAGVLQGCRRIVDFTYWALFGYSPA